MPRYSACQKEGDILSFSAEVSHHAVSVMRVRIGEEIEAVHEGTVFAAQVTSLKPFEARLIHEIKEDRELRANLILGFALLKGGHDEMILQKGTELGVHAFLPLETERVIIRFKKEAEKENRRERYQKIVTGAVEQCRRSFVPKVEKITNVNDVIHYPAEVKLFAYEKEAIEGKTLKEALVPVQDHQNVLLLLGPEGGWSETEADRLLKAGFLPISLGRRILRAETAAIFAASVFASEEEKR